MESEEKKMSYYTLSNKELSQLIRKDLKKHGFLKKDYSMKLTLNFSYRYYAVLDLQC